MMTKTSAPHSVSYSTLRFARAGFTLIELLVAMVIGLMLIGGVVQLFVGISRNNADMASTNEQIENGRFVLQTIQNDVVHGGFWNGFVPEFDDLTAASAPTDIPTAIPAPCAAYSTWNTAYKTGLLGIPVQVYDSVPSGCTSLIADKKANTDLLIVRHADICAPGDANCEADTSSSASPKVYFQAQLCGDTAASAYVYVLAHNTVGGPPTTVFNLKKRDCATAAEKRKYVSNIYYVRNDNTLMRVEFGGTSGFEWGTPQELITGVEGFAVELGIDYLSDSGADITAGSPAGYTQVISWSSQSVKNSPTNRGDGAPDGAFIRCGTGCTVGQLINTVAVKLHVLVRSSSTSLDYTDDKSYALANTTLGPFNDHYKRHIYTTTVRLNNVSARRQTP